MAIIVESGFKTYQPNRGISVADYRPPALFPDFYRIQADHKKWDYLAREMAAMAEAGTLFLTDVLLQPDRVAGVAADVIMGVQVVDHMQTRKHPPAILQTYKVHVRSLSDETIKWEQDIARGDLIRKGASEGLDMMRDDAPMAAYRAEPEWVDTGSTDAMLTLQQAVLCLKQAGKYVRRAKRSGLQSKQWRWEEIRPEAATKTDEPAPKQPKRSFAEANKG